LSVGQEPELDCVPFEDAQPWGGNDSLVDLYVLDDRIVGIIPFVRLAVPDPFERPPWFDGRAVTREMVRQALENGRLCEVPYPGFDWSSRTEWTNERHAERIAHLYVNRTPEPITVEFTDPHMACMEVIDGWHRIAAATMREDREIAIEVGGFFRHSVVRLGAICREYQRIGELVLSPDHSSLAMPGI
jgi:hypothetical protein